MTWKELEKKVYALNQRKNIFYTIIFYLYSWEKKDFILNENKVVSKKDKQKIIRLAKKELKKPLEYIFKKAHFFESELYINKNVLIPRRETELLVEEVLTDNKNYKIYADICTGSGCIGISVMKHKIFEKVYFADISRASLKITKKNLISNNLTAQLIRGDYLKPFLKNNIKLNLLTINPPYIEKKDVFLENKVVKNEPHRALFAKEKGLFFYRKLFENLESLMDTSKEFKIICEFGFEQKELIKKLYKYYNFNYDIQFKKDYSQNWRYFVIMK